VVTELLLFDLMFELADVRLERLSVLSSSRHFHNRPTFSLDGFLSICVGADSATASSEQQKDIFILCWRR
jgi:hypothetical protein